MPVFLTRVLGRLVFLRSWATPLVVSAFVFLTAWPLMALAEGADSPLVQPANYWWWFVVTASTVGYGDFFPASASGHVVGAYVIFGGIVTLTTIFTKLVSVLENARGRLMQGAITVDATNHIVLLGYTPGRTERIADQLLADGGRVVLCAWDDVAAHPMADRDMDFVRGDLSDVDVLKRAAVHKARRVLIDARDDNEALAVAVAVDHARSDGHVVVALRDMQRASHLRYVDEAIQCVQWHSPRMLTEELQSPGITKVYAELMTHGGGANTYSVTLPEWLGPVTVGECQTALGRRHGATVLAVRSDSELLVNPDWETRLPASAVLYYMSSRPLGAEQIAQSVRSAS